MNAKDLRIGNFIGRYRENKPEIDVVKSIYYDDEAKRYSFELNSGKCTGITESGIIGIVLTPELLSICGFTEVSERYGPTYYKLDDFILAKCADELCVAYEYEGYTGRMEFAYLSQHIKTLHQLQNIYYALTGEELNVNIPTL